MMRSARFWNQTTGFYQAFRNWDGSLTSQTLMKHKLLIGSERHACGTMPATLVALPDILTARSLSLIKTTVETVRTRLDTAYLETLDTAERSGAVKPATREEVTELQEEVESLYSEILSVAQMSTEQQHLEPALQAIAAKSGQSLGKTVSSLKYVRPPMLSTDLHGTTPL